MTQTNGQDKSDVFQRDLGRQGLERAQEKSLAKSFLTASQPEETGSAWSRLFGFEPMRAVVRREGRLLERPSALWNVGFENEPATERKDFPASFPIRSRQEPKGLAEGYKSICERWSLDILGMAKLLHLEEEIGLCDLVLSGQVPPMTGDLKDRMAMVIGISIGLGELFDDAKDAELQWLTTKRSELGGFSPLEHMLKGDLLNLRDVVDLVDNARGLG